MKISNAEFGTFDMDRKVYFASSGQVLDVAIPAVFWSTRNGTGTFATNTLLDLITSRTGMDIGRFRRLRNDPLETSCRDQLLFPPVPFLKNFGRRRAAENARMNQTSKFDTGNMARSTIDALKVPDGFGPAEISKRAFSGTQGCARMGINLVQEPAPIVLVEDAGESPGMVLEWLHIMDFD